VLKVVNSVSKRLVFTCTEVYWFISTDVAAQVEVFLVLFSSEFSLGEYTLSKASQIMFNYLLIVTMAKL